MTRPRAKAKNNPLSNKEFLREIHKTKNSYSYFTEKEYENYDIILPEGVELTAEIINECRQAKATLLETKERRRQKEEGVRNIKVDEIDLNTIEINGLILRQHTYEHIPDLLPEQLKGTPKKPKDFKVKLNFIPFKQYVIEYDGDKINVDVSAINLREVGRSHWENGLSNGNFTMSNGQITNRLAHMYKELVDRYGQKLNWRGYSYLDEMKAQARLQLVFAGLKFDECKSQNPFAYFTTIMTTTFTGVFNEEKKNQVIRDDILTKLGHSPSHTRMVENEMKSNF